MAPSSSINNIILIISLLLSVGVYSVRGVPPKGIPRYSADSFTCDGSKSIHSTSINDEYCDCDDASDEPGTSACTRGRFFCVNKGYRGSYVPSSRVNDGICDCCDGSDEYSTNLQCNNNCIELARHSQQGLVAAVELHNKGSAVRKGMVAQGNALINTWSEDASKLESEVNAINAALDQAKKKKEELEAVEAAEKAAEEAKKAAEVVAAPATETSETTAAEAVVSAEQDNNNNDPQPQQQEQQQEERFPYPKEYQYKKEEKQEGEAKQEHFPYPEEYRFKTGEEQAKEGTPQDEEEAKRCADEEAAKKAKEEEEEKQQEVESQPPQDSAAKIAADAARAEVEELERKKRDADSKLDSAKSKLNHDYGADKEYATYNGKCFSAQQRQYTYEVCPYGNAEQKEGSSFTSLGKWEGWSDDHTQMKFTGGYNCWNGPDRSLTVTVECGTTEELFDIEEPSRCVYAVKLRSPAACSTQKAHEMEKRLAAGLPDEE